MKVLNDSGESVTAMTRSGVYYLGEQHPVDLQRENDILKQRCSFHSDVYVCQCCPFNCVYRKKVGSSNDR